MGAAHHYYEDGDVKSFIPRFHPYGSQTIIVAGRSLPGVLDSMERATAKLSSPGLILL